MSPTPHHTVFLPPLYFLPLPSLKSHTCRTPHYSPRSDNTKEGEEEEKEKSISGEGEEVDIQIQAKKLLERIGESLKRREGEEGRGG